MGVLFIILGIISISYDVILLVLNPGTFLDNLFAFSHIWSAFGFFVIFAGIFRLKTKHSLWSTLKKGIQLLIVCIFDFSIILVLINLFLILNPAEAFINEPADQVIVLGGGISKEGKLPKSVIFRVNKAAEYLENNPQSICVVTGGTLKWLPYAEAPEIKRQLITAGISEDRILVEDKALDTIQNFQLSCKMLAEYRGVSMQEVLETPTAVVTSRFHLRRAERLAKRIGFTNIKGISAACPAIYVPHNYIREICAYVKLNLRILFTGEPKKITNIR